MKRWIKVAIVAPVAVIALGLVGFSIWALTPPAPMVEAEAALQSDSAVIVTTSTSLTFQPATGAPKTGLIFYPGGRVDPKAYAPLAHEIAAQGYLVVIARMPLNMAVFSPGRAAAVMKQHSEVSNWVVGGHSLGGAMAANYARANSDKVRGLVLLGAYPAQSDDLSDLPLSVAVIYGSEDGLASTAQVESARPQLPSDTRWVLIDGANHAQFGWYGPQPGDLQAKVSRDEQTQRTVDAVIEILQGSAE